MEDILQHSRKVQSWGSAHTCKTHCRVCANSSKTERSILSTILKIDRTPGWREHHETYSTGIKPNKPPLTTTTTTTERKHTRPDMQSGWSQHVVNPSCKFRQCDSEYWRNRRLTHVVRFTGQNSVEGAPLLSREVRHGRG